MNNESQPEPVEEAKKLRADRICLARPRITARDGVRNYYNLATQHPQPTMKSIKNLTRMTYETTSFVGWRLSLSSKGTNFTKYFSDKKFGDGKKSFAAAEAALAEVKAVVKGAKLVDGKHTAATIGKVQKLLAKA